MSKTALTGDAKAAEPRQVPVVNPNHVVKQADGFQWREFMVRLPDGTIADDLKEPSMWSRVQSGINSLRKFDRLFLVAYDESWAAECRVASSDGTKAVLTKPALISFPERFDQLFQDDTYRVVWIGTGYAVERKADKHIMTQPVASAAVAERELARLYPQRVA